jgi:murein hydrolase activator
MVLKPRLIPPVIVVLCGFLTVGAFAHDKDQPKEVRSAKTIQNEQKELDRLKKELQEQERKKQAAQKKEKSVLSTLDDLDRRMVTGKKELDSINRKLTNRTEGIDRLEKDIASLKKELDSKKDRVSSRVRTLYQESRMNSLRILFASQDYYEFMKRYYYLSWISQSESELISGYRETLSRLGEKEEKMKTARAELLKNRRDVAGKLGEVRDTQREKGRLLASVRKDKAVHERAIEELTESANRVTALIQELEKRRKSSMASVGFSKLKGKMPWPARGKVVGFFGRQKHPKFDTLISRKGIDIQSRLGDPIRAVHEGKVVYADWFRGFGLLVILEHGDEFYSLYANAARLSISVGDTVKRQQIIGEIGDTGLTGDPNLYFEIRKGDEPVNPLAWLERP